MQARNPERVNVSIDGRYRFSLDIAQLTDLGVKKGRELDEDELAELMSESEFGRLYARALEYCLMRPHSSREMRDYLYRKTVPRRYKNKKGEIKERAGVAKSITERVFDRLVDRRYVDDEKFARWWVETRNQTKGTSIRKLSAELRAKGVDPSIIETTLAESPRDDHEELTKIIAKKRARYPDDQKFIAYLARQGFRYDDIKAALSDET